MGKKRKDNTSNEGTSGDEKVNSQTDHNSNVMEAMNSENTMDPDCISLLPKKREFKVTEVVVRRSNRLRHKTSEPSNGRQKVEIVVEKLNLGENEKDEAPKDRQIRTTPVISGKNLEDEAPKDQQNRTTPVISEENLEDEEPKDHQQNRTTPVISERNLEEVRTTPVRSERNLEEAPPQTQQVKHVPLDQRNVEEKVTRGLNEGSSGDISYKSLYIDSQKKIEILMEKHYELVKKLEYAHGKIEAYERMIDAMSAPKETVFARGREMPPNPQ